LRPNRRAVLLVAVVFTVAAVILLYEGITSGNYLIVTLVVVAYMFVLSLEARLSLRPAEPAAKEKPAKKPRVSHPR
jgi:heme O synthase-like polyprenyltransferase